MVNDMVDRVLTCTLCSLRGHLAASCGMRAVCSACSRTGHFSRDCNDFTCTNVLAWRPISLQQSTSISENPAGQGNGAGVIGIACPVASSSPTLHQSPLLLPMKTPSPPQSGRLWQTTSLIHNALFRQAITSSMVATGVFPAPSSRRRWLRTGSMRIMPSPLSSQLLCLKKSPSFGTWSVTLLSMIWEELFWMPNLGSKELGDFVFAVLWLVKL